MSPNAKYLYYLVQYLYNFTLTDLFFSPLKRDAN